MAIVLVILLSEFRVVRVSMGRKYVKTITQIVVCPHGTLVGSPSCFRSQNCRSQTDTPPTIYTPTTYCVDFQNPMPIAFRCNARSNDRIIGEAGWRRDGSGLQ